MKKLFSFLYICGLVPVSAYSSVTDFSGEWEYDRGNIGAGGQMTISNCHNGSCSIEFSTYNGAHICDLENAILNIKGDTANIKIKDYSECKISISKKSDGIIEVLDNENCGMLCGMSGYFTGRWRNIKLPKTYPAGFDCDYAKTDVELTICHDKNLAQFDREIAILYKKAAGQKPAQKKWLAGRNVCKTDTKCMTEKYDARLRELTVAVSNKDFSLFDYAHLVSEDGWFHPNDAVLIANFIRDKIGNDAYDNFVACSNRRTADIFNENEIFAGYGCPGLFTLMESAIYIDRNQIWLSYLDNGRITTFGPRGKSVHDIPQSLSDWIKDLKNRAGDNIESEKVEFEFKL